MLVIYYRRGFFDKGLKFRSMILPDKFIDQDTPENMYKVAGLDSESIIQKVEDVLNSNIVIAKNKISPNHIVLGLKVGNNAG